MDKENIIRFESKYTEGLSYEEVLSRQKDRLTNEIKSNPFFSYIKIIIKNLVTFYNILLFALGAILLYAGQIKNCVFLVIVLCNTGIGLFQDIRAKIKLEKLSILNQGKIEVIRNSTSINIDSKEIVLDDIVHLKAGEQIPCDGIILHGEGKFNEAILTGESLTLKKKKGDSVLSGSYIEEGEIYIRAEAVGKESYSNQIQEKSKEFKSPKSLIHLHLNRLFKTISIVVVVVGISMVLTKVFKNDILISHENFVKQIAPICGSLISMIPSGMYLLISTSLTVTAISLANKKVLVQDMYSVETLARVDTLCIDKTGTLTEGNLFVSDTVNVNNKFNDDQIEAIMSSFLNGLNDNNFTSISLIKKFGQKEIFKTNNVLHFNSTNKYSCVNLERVGTITIGAFGFVKASNNKDVEEKINNYSKEGYRVLVIAHSKENIKEDFMPGNSEIFGLILLRDNLRKNVVEIVNGLQNNGVEIKVISGDNVLTVAEIAKHAGIKNYHEHISLEGLSKEEVKEAALKYSIFGRTSPEQKEIIIKTLKENKKTVGMFGDGINDVLALKRAHVGISIGQAAKSAKDVSSLILLNNDFGEVPSVIKEGKRIIANLERICCLFLNKTIFSILLNIVFILFSVSSLFNYTYPFSPQNFYLWEILSIGIPSFFLVLEGNTKTILKGNFIRNIMFDALPNGILLAFFVTLLYILGGVLGINEEQLLTLSVYLFSFASIVYLIDVCIPISGLRFVLILGNIICSIILFILPFIAGISVLGLERNITKSQFLLFTVVPLILIGVVVIAKNLYKKWRIKNG